MICNAWHTSPDRLIESDNCLIDRKTVWVKIAEWRDQKLDRKQDATRELATSLCVAFFAIIGYCCDKRALIGAETAAPCIRARLRTSSKLFERRIFGDICALNF